MTSGMQAAPTVAQRSQYHHYVPRFILRNYTDPNQQPVVNTGNKKQDKNKQRRIRQTRDFMLNVVNLQDVELEQQPLSQTFGVTDMYRDFDTSKPDQHYLEKELSKLESRAGEIIANVRKAFDAGKGQVELLRGERNDLRKFLFIMLYRNRMFQSRFNISMEEYSANDRKEMLAYMKEKNFTRPIDVWFSNIRAFLELKIVAQEDWMEKITSQAYPPDAIWFFKYMQMSFLSFCTPEVPEDEFLLTQNAYSIYEGCTSELAWTDFHNFAPVSPRLIIVLRSFLLPSGFDEHESERLKFLEMSNSMHSNPEKVRSVLVDLPVTKALNNYSKIVDRKHVLLPTKIRPENHKFYFKFFPISTAHAQKINSIMLEEALGTSALVYKTSSSLRRAVEAYFEDSNFKTMVKVPPVIESLLSGFATMKLPGLGVYYKWTDTHGIPYLNTLNQIAKRLGSTSVAKYVILDPNSSKKDFTNNDDFTKRYMRLGGRDPKKLTKEMHQAQLMWKMTYKIDSAMRYQSDECKATIRENRARFFCEFPPYRVWLYLKIVRDAATRGPNQNIPPHIDPDVGGLEDVYADVYHLFRPGYSFCRTIHRAIVLDNFLITHPNFGLLNGHIYDLDERSYMMLEQEQGIVFGNPGSIRDCGIPKIERRAEFHYNMAQRLRVHDQHGKIKRLILSDHQNFELATRNAVRSEFAEILRDELEPGTLEKFERVFFDKLYRNSFGARMP